MFLFFLFRSQMMTKLVHLMQFLAPPIVVHKCIYPNRWPNCDRKLQCRCFRVSHFKISPIWCIYYINKRECHLKENIFWSIYLRKLTNKQTFSVNLLIIVEHNEKNKTNKKFQCLITKTNLFCYQSYFITNLSKEYHFNKKSQRFQNTFCMISPE